MYMLILDTRGRRFVIIPELSVIAAVKVHKIKTPNLGQEISGYLKMFTDW